MNSPTLSAETIRSRSGHLERYVSRAPERLRSDELTALCNATLTLCSSLEQRAEQLLAQARLPAAESRPPRK